MLNRCCFNGVCLLGCSFTIYGHYAFILSVFLRVTNPLTQSTVFLFETDPLTLLANRLSSFSLSIPTAFHDYGLSVALYFFFMLCFCMFSVDEVCMTFDDGVIRPRHAKTCLRACAKCAGISSYACAKFHPAICFPFIHSVVSNNL